MRARLSDKIESGRIRSGLYGSTSADAPSGAFEVMGPCGAPLKIIAGEGNDEIQWEHVSVSLRHRAPNWREMNWVKDQFWLEEECVVQFHPPRSSYVNHHEHCLHLWRSKVAEFPLPPKIAV